jgi:alpha-tubulin suppressor-like RCC1 family protein
MPKRSHVLARVPRFILLIGCVGLSSLLGCPLEEEDEESADVVANGSKGVFQRIVLSPRGAEVNQGEKLTVRAQSVDGYQYDLDDTYTFSSQQPGIISISPEGVATGLALGTATLEVKSNTYGKTATMTLACSPTRGTFEPTIRVPIKEIEQDLAVPVELTISGNAAVLAGLHIDAAPLGISLEGASQVRPGVTETFVLKTSIRTPPGTHRVRLSVLDPVQARVGTSFEFDLVVREPRPTTFTWKKIAWTGGIETGGGIGLTTDGRLIDWGALDKFEVPSTLVRDIKDIAIGAGLALALHQDGSLSAWGQASKDALRALDPGQRFKAIAVASLSNNEHALALREDGGVVAFGDASLGATSVPSLPKVREIAAGDGFSLAIGEDGTLHGWGRRIQMPASPLTGVKQVSAFGNLAVVLRDDGTAVILGFSRAPTTVPGVTGIQSVSMSNAVALLLRSDGSVVSVLSDGSMFPDAQVLTGLTNIFGGDGVSGGIDSSGNLVTWGSSKNPARVAPRSGVGVAAVSSQLGSMTSRWITRTDGSFVGFGSENRFGELDVPDGLTRVVQLAVGEGAVVALKADGTLVGWGRSALANVPRGLPPVKAIASDGARMVALLEDTSLFGWPDNSGTPLPSGPTGMVSFVEPGFRYGRDANGKIVSPFEATPELFGGAKPSHVMSCAPVALVDGRLRAGPGLLMPPGHHSLLDLNCMSQPDGRAVWGIAVRPDSRPLIWNLAASPESRVPEIELDPGPQAPAMFALEGFTRISGDAFIRGSGDRAVAYIPYSTLPLVIR